MSRSFRENFASYFARKPFRSFCEKCASSFGNGWALTISVSMCSFLSWRFGKSLEREAGIERRAGHRTELQVDVVDRIVRDRIELREVDRAVRAEATILDADIDDFPDHPAVRLVIRDELALRSEEHT